MIDVRATNGTFSSADADEKDRSLCRGSAHSANMRRFAITHTERKMCGTFHVSAMLLATES